MRKINLTKKRALIDAIPEWFSQRSKFWTLISLLTFVSLITLQIFFIFLTEINSQVRQEIDSLLIPLLALFVFSFFWRGLVQTFLSLAGVMSVYAGMSFIYFKAAGLQTLPPLIANRLVYDKIVASSPVDSVASYYFFVGIIGLVLCFLITFKPSLFKSKGTQIRLSYPFWKNEDDPKLAFGSNIIRLIPVLCLLSFAERHLVAKYRYVVVTISGTIYFVSPDDWVPEGSSVIRDKESGSLLGIPKVADGFNVW